LADLAASTKLSSSRKRGESQAAQSVIWILDDVAQHILHLKRGKLTLWTGGYSQFERQRREAQILAGNAIEKLEERRANLQAFVDRFRAKASKPPRHKFGFNTTARSESGFRRPRSHTDQNDRRRGEQNETGGGEYARRAADVEDGSPGSRSGRNSRLNRRH
jgi:ATPase subunit of ABC transporter with duplicated ATPase domains